MSGRLTRREQVREDVAELVPTEALARETTLVGAGQQPDHADGPVAAEMVGDDGSCLADRHRRRVSRDQFPDEIVVVPCHHRDDAIEVERVV